MRNSLSVKGFPCVRLAMLAVLIVSEWTVAGGFSVGWASQDSAPSPAPRQVGEPGKEKRPVRKPKEEEEETTKPAPRAPLRVGDEDLDANPRTPAARPGTIPPADLKIEAKRAKHPAVQELYSALAEPHDVVTMNQNLRVWTVEPIAEFINPKSGTPPRITLRPFDAAGKHRQAFSVASKEILGVEPYELLAVKKVDEFLKRSFEQDPENKLPRLVMLQEAEKVLGAVLLFHDSAVQRGLRKGNAWSEPRQRLVAKLQEVLLEQLQALTDLKNWDAALDLGTRLAAAYPSRKGDFEVKIVRLLAQSARASFKSKNYGLTRLRLGVLEAHFPNHPELEPIRADLRQAALGFLRQAQTQEQRGETKAAIALLVKAKDIAPDLPGLRDFDLRLNKLNPVLYVGVPDLPKAFSPATAYTDSEKQAVELLFEGLLKPIYTAKMGQRYEPGLAAELPKMVPLGRLFTLAHGAHWSNGDPVIATDVRNTVRLLCASGSRAYVPEWAELMKEGAHTEADNFHIRLTLHQGYLDPLSLMDFKILPPEVNRADDSKFATHPIGSGPYKLDKQDGNSVVFTANPYYEMRPGKAGLPRIREIHFVRSENPTTDFQEDRLQLLLDLPSSRYKELDSAGLGGTVTFLTLRNRRIYMLAVNHGRPPLDSQPLRRAIAHAIHRDAILDKCFRAELTPTPHRPLNGPYPPGSWACPQPPADPYKLDLAKAQARKATEGHAILRKLSLKYPKGDPDVEKACAMIRDQVRQLGAGIDLELEALEPRDLRHVVEDLRDYDLAYYSWDYPDETYWLWPLLDPQAKKSGGRNFLNYPMDGDLQSLFRQVMNRRNPAEVKRLTQQIRVDFADKMPFIPLWQLDTHLAIHKNLSMVDLRDKPVDPDPLRIFTNVETWKLEKR